MQLLNQYYIARKPPQAYGTRPPCSSSKSDINTTPSLWTIPMRTFTGRSHQVTQVESEARECGPRRRRQKPLHALATFAPSSLAFDALTLGDLLIKDGTSAQRSNDQLRRWDGFLFPSRSLWAAALGQAEVNWSLLQS